MICFYDFETTSINPFLAEILTAYFYITDDEGNFISDLEVKMRPELIRSDWLQAQAVHGITKDEALAFPPKQEGLDAIFNFLPSCVLCCYSNPNAKLGHYQFDYACLKMQAFSLSYEKYQWFITKWRADNCIDVHQMAKQAYKNKHIAVKKNKKNRPIFSLDSVASAFNFKFVHHDAREDTLVLKDIFFKLKEFVDVRYMLENH